MVNLCSHMNSTLTRVLHVVQCCCWCCLEILTKFWTQGLYFHFALGPTSYVANSDDNQGSGDTKKIFPRKTDSITTRRAQIVIEKELNGRLRLQNERQTQDDSDISPFRIWGESRYRGSGLMLWLWPLCDTFLCGSTELCLFGAAPPG